MSQATRALVERLKRETTHLPGNVPLHNKALETITEILDSMVEPVEEPEEVEEPEAAVDAQAETDMDEQAETGPAVDESPVADESDNDPMTTENSPT